MKNKRYTNISWEELNTLMKKYSVFSNELIGAIGDWIESKTDPSNWEEYPENKWGNKSDLEFFRDFTGTNELCEGTNIIITYKSYKPGGSPFKVNGEVLEAFIEEYADEMNDVFFTGFHTIIINITKNIVFMFNHENFWICTNTLLTQ